MLGNKSAKAQYLASVRRACARVHRNAINIYRFGVCYYTPRRIHRSVGEIHRRKIHSGGKQRAGDCVTMTCKCRFARRPGVYASFFRSRARLLIGVSRCDRDEIERYRTRSRLALSLSARARVNTFTSDFSSARPSQRSSSFRVSPAL